MDEHVEDPVGQAGQKVVQYASLATMAAEAIAQVRQQRAAAAAAGDAQTAAVVRAQRTAALTAAQAQWQPVLDSRLRGRTSLGDAGLAWAAAQGWRDVEPQAALASDRAEQRLHELRPDVMERFDRLTGDGLDPVEAMRRVAPFFDRPAARPGEHTRRSALPAMPAVDAVLEPGRDDRDPRLTPAGVDTSSSASRQHYIDTGQYLPTSETAARTVRSEPGMPAKQVTQDDVLAVDAAAAASTAATTCSRTAAELAKDGFPEQLTAEVLAAGRVRPKAPATTAPAAVRSAGLATAARAAGQSR
ncbi:MAG: hypothetical protein F2825_00245 [Actinobacteria bacterium]|uniref:Unannotated protein n=1 Tax=freshwater metagenome TaxID=449393 RepID=A0A6J7FLM4_9ZZZZ|nr:hypothetical protein [Actinomycetota bacterium]